MIKINFVEPTTDDWNKWKETCNKKKEALLLLAERGEEWEIDNVYKAMKDVYYAKCCGKCIYCEKKIEEPYQSEIEHYRPKKRVTFRNDTPVMKNGTEHPGYYWLAYDWDNLLLSCQVCNKPNNYEENKLGKRNRFPVEDNYYATSPGEETNEKPLLINPTKEDPIDYIEYNPDNGYIDAIGNNKKGSICIEIFGLNIRDDLVDGRREAYDKVNALFAKLPNVKGAGRQEVLDKLEEIKSGMHPHAIAAFAAIEEYKKDVLPLLG